jgi:serine/threonine protein kinase
MRGANCPHCQGFVPLAAGSESTVPIPAADRTQDSTAKYSSAGDQPTHEGAGGQRSAAFPLLSPPVQQDEIGRLGHYRVLAELGRGGMGMVFRAQDTDLKRLVALKVMLPQCAANPTDKARFLREARAQAAVEHDHVAAIFQVGEANGVPFLAMPLLHGQTLGAALHANPVVPLAEAVRVARETAEGLAAAHERGLVHRDIKPANIWLEGNRRRVKILDFGLARQFAEAPEQEEPGTEITRRGAVIGTPAYMSPEQAHGDQLDARSDLFSLGSVLYQMLAGQAPFRGGSATAVLIAVATETPPPPSALNPGVPDALDALTMQLMEKRPDARPPSAEEVAERLRAIEYALSAGGNLPPGPVVVPASLRAPGAPADPWADIDVTEEVDPDGSRALVTAHGPGPKNSARPFRPALLGVLGAFIVLGVVVAVFAPAPGRATVTVEFADDQTQEQFRRNARLVLVANVGGEYVLAGEAPSRRIDPGSYTARVEGDPELILAQTAFDVARGSEIKILVQRTKREKITVLPDPERDAALFVLSIGGLVSVDGEKQEIRAPADLPRTPFRLTRVDLMKNPQATDQAMTAFKNCRHLNSLSLLGTPVGDLGLAQFAGCTELTDLNLRNPAITDAGLASFKGCKKLSRLILADTQATDEGLKFLADCPDMTYAWLPGNRQLGDGTAAALAGCPRLMLLNMHGTKVTDAGLGQFKNIKTLEFLELPGTAVSAAGLVHFAGCTNLKKIDLGACPNADDAALAVFRECKELQTLWLPSAPVTDASLEQIAKYPKLKHVILRDTKVTAKGLAQLRAALPQCRID